MVPGLLKTSSPHLLLCELESPEDFAELAASARIAHVFHSSPLDCGAPFTLLPASDEAAAHALREAVKAAPGESTEAGDSSDEEGEGVRLRVRLTRSGDEKWGVKWHKGIFKASHRLVVDDVAEDSLLAAWNEGQPEGMKVRYGDRLLRINGVTMEGVASNAVAERMRAELQKEKLRALFWRPGEAPPKAPPRAVLLCAEAGCAARAAALAAAALAGDDASLERRRAALGEAAAMLEEAVQPAAPLEALPATAPSAVAEAPIVEEPPIVAQAVEEVHEANAEEEAAEEEKAAAQWTYSCRKCGLALFQDVNVLPHNRSGKKKAGRDWAAGEEVACTSLFVEPMRWMGECSEETGKLLCVNPRCGQKLGSFCWHGLPCSCGQWQSPAFQIHCSRVDCMPVGRRQGGARPKALF